MKRTLRILAVLLFLSLAVQLGGTSQAAAVSAPQWGTCPFADVSLTAWYCKEVTHAHSIGLVQGVTSTSFAPGKSVTRGEFVTMLCRMFESWEDFPEEGTSPFADVEEEQYYAPYIAWAWEQGVVNGRTETTFAPMDRITRQDAATILYRIQALEGLPQIPFIYDPLAFADDGLIEAYARTAISVLQQQGLMGGTPDGKINPMNQLTRAEAAALIARFHSAITSHTHAYEKTIVTQPDCTSLGLAVYSCPCGSYYGEELPQTHAYEQSIVAPTCTAQGYEQYTCSLCGKYFRQCFVAALGHDLVLTNVEADETKEYTCTRCGEKEYDPPKQVIKTLQYGTSGSGNYPLTATQIGNGSNVMVLTFALHGWEDNYARDGEALVYLADCLTAYLENHYDAVKNNDWTVYILRCCNPDGLYLGNTCNGPGRCTTTYYDANGNLRTGKGIDMNRCFPYNFQQKTNSRNYTGSAPLLCAEARALAAFVQEVKGSANNICIDTHGWYQQILTSSGQGTIYKAFRSQFSGMDYGKLYGGGYFTSYCAYSLGYDSCLFELPRGIYSHNAFVNSGYVEKFEAVILKLLQTYKSPNTTSSWKEPVTVWEQTGN